MLWIGLFVELFEPIRNTGINFSHWGLEPTDGIQCWRMQTCSIILLAIHLFIHPSFDPSIHSFFPPSVHPSIHPSIHPCTHSSNHQPIGQAGCTFTSEPLLLRSKLEWDWTSSLKRSVTMMSVMMIIVMLMNMMMVMMITVMLMMTTTMTTNDDCTSRVPRVSKMKFEDYWKETLEPCWRLLDLTRKINQ